MPFDPPPPPQGPRLQTRSVLVAVLTVLLSASMAAAFVGGNRELSNNLAVGVLSAVSTIVGFYFGSSRGSQAKDATIAALSGKDGEP
ncbi:hypothetical protein BH09PSE2_BH09PSE2_15050 [soil metagenome]